MESTAYPTPSSTPHLRLVEDRAPYDPGFVIVPQQLRDLPPTVDIKDGKKPIPRAAMTGVYVELAAYAIASNVVWPSVKTLAETTGYSEDYVARVLVALEQCRVLTKSHRDNHGMKRSNQYTLIYQKTPEQQIPPTAATIPPTAGQDTATGGSGYRPQRHEVDNSERDKREVKNPPTPLPEHGPAQRIVKVWCEEVGLDRPTDYRRAVGQAQHLVKAGLAPDDARDLIRWIRQQEWVTSSLDLGLMYKLADKWRTDPKRVATAPKREPTQDELRRKQYADWFPGTFQSVNEWYDRRDNGTLPVKGLLR